MIDLSLNGTPPQNEEDALDIAARLVRSLNREGDSWSEVEQGTADIDALAKDAGPPARTLEMQVVRASTNKDIWKTMAQTGSAQKRMAVAECAHDLLQSITKKANKYPLAQRKRLTLILDAGRTPSHTFTTVHQHFRNQSGTLCADFSFSSVWVVGHTDALVARLDQ